MHIKFVNGVTMKKIISNKITKCVYETQAKAIEKAISETKRRAKDSGVDCESIVALQNECTLTIKVTPDGKIRKSKKRGWILMNGFVYMNKLVWKIVCLELNAQERIKALSFIDGCGLLQQYENYMNGRGISLRQLSSGWRE